MHFRGKTAFLLRFLALCAVFIAAHAALTPDPRAPESAPARAAVVTRMGRMQNDDDDDRDDDSSSVSDTSVEPDGDSDFDHDAESTADTTQTPSGTSDSSGATSDASEGNSDAPGTAQTPTGGTTSAEASSDTSARAPDGDAGDPAEPTQYRPGQVIATDRYSGNTSIPFRDNEEKRAINASLPPGLTTEIEVDDQGNDVGYRVVVYNSQAYHAHLGVDDSNVVRLEIGQYISQEQYGSGNWEVPEGYTITRRANPDGTFSYGISRIPTIHGRSTPDGTEQPSHGDGPGQPAQQSEGEGVFGDAAAPGQVFRIDNPHANLGGTHARRMQRNLNADLPPGLTAEYREDGDDAWYQVTVYDPAAYREYLGIDDSAVVQFQPGQYVSQEVIDSGNWEVPEGHGLARRHNADGSVDYGISRIARIHGKSVGDDAPAESAFVDGVYSATAHHGPSGSAADHPSRTDPDHPNYRPPTEEVAPNQADEFSTENEPDTPPLSPGSGFFEQDTVLDGSLGTVEQAEADAEAHQQRQARPDEPDDDDDDRRLVKDDDAQALEDVGGFGGGGYTGPGLVGQENTDPQMFSHEVEEEPEVAPNVASDDYNEDDAVGNLGRAFTDEDRDAAADLDDSQVEVNYFDEPATQPHSTDETTGLDLGDGVTRPEKGTGIESAAHSTDENLDLGDGVTRTDQGTGIESAPHSTDEIVDLGDGQSRATPTSIASHSTGDEERSMSGAGQEPPATEATPDTIPLDGLPRQGTRPPDGYHLVRLNDGSYVYRRARPFSAVRDAAEDWLASRPEGQQVPLQTHLYMGEGSPHFYLDESRNLTTTERETAERWDEFHGTHISPVIAGGVGDSINRITPWEHPLAGNVAGELAAAATNPLEWIPGEGFVTAYQMLPEIAQLPRHAGQYALGQLPGQQYPQSHYPPDPYAPQPGGLVLNDQGIPVAVQNTGAAPRPSYVVDPTGQRSGVTFEDSVVWPAVAAADALLPTAAGVAIVRSRNAPEAPPAGGPPGSSRSVRAQPGQPRQPVYSYTDPATGEPVFTAGSPPPSQSSAGSSTGVYTYIDQDGNRLYLTDAPQPGTPSTGGDYYPGFLDEGDPRPWGGDAPDPRPPDPDSGGSYRTPGGQQVDTYTTQDGQTIYTVEYPEVDASQQPVNVSGDGSVLGATFDADAAVVVADPEPPAPAIEPEVEPDIPDDLPEPDPDIWFPEEDPTAPVPIRRDTEPDPDIWFPEEDPTAPVEPPRDPTEPDTGKPEPEPDIPNPNPDVPPETPPATEPGTEPRVRPRRRTEPEITPEISTEISTEVTPEISTEISTEITPEISTEISTEITPEISTEISTEVTPEISTEISTEITPEISTEISTEITPEISTEISTEITPEVMKSPPRYLPRSRLKSPLRYLPRSRLRFPPRYRPRSRLRSPPRYRPRSRLRSPPRYLPRSRLKSPPRYLPRSRLRSPPRYLPRSRLKSPPRYA